ncbi:TonB-dependent receptor domain-containing protein [Sphingobium sp. CR28]|uniref:TonB-dependent receptor domain-containing protein n=1 Tax=Sphingobium sp. CR28 TaxID=3400272 RepID=UPI003FEFEF6D
MNRTRNASILLIGASAIALTPSALAQTAPSSTNAASVSGSDSDQAGQSAASNADIIVTGSRVVSNGNQAPTPVTVIATERLQQTTPSNIPDALNRLPQFAAQPSTRNIGNAQGNATGNFLNLRRFGSNRNLVLLDGSRVPPTAASGAVDTNTIPQSLVERVEIVTGGASAVYGSDAVTGVINFIINKKFNGLKANAQIGTSTYGDNSSWRFGIAGGMPIFGERGHIEASFDHYDSKGLIGVGVRKPADQIPTVGGAGTQANPFRLIYNGRILTGNRGGFISNTNTGFPAALRELTFNTDGIPTRFVHGANSGVNGLESGGDGGYYDATTYLAPVRTNQAFGRFDYELTDDINFYVQGTYSSAFADYQYASVRYSSTILSGNPLIPTAIVPGTNQTIQQIMTATNTPSITIARLQSVEDGWPPRTNHVLSTNAFAMGGFSGKIFGDFDWSVNYIYSVSKQHVKNRNNTNVQKLAAALDAVTDPATGRVVCQVSLTQFASLYPGCEPMNVFGPTAPSKGAQSFVLEDTFFTLTNRMQDVNFAISGSPFDLWAGPVRVALSGEYRWLSLRNRSSVEATAPADCTGLRANCAGLTKYQHDVSSSIFAKQNVKEIAGELLIPLLKDVPLVRSLELNLAGRYTDYSTSGSVETWKIGGTWEPVEGIRFRASRSRDIRAPTLQDLFAPLSQGPSGFTDLHTNISRVTNIYTQGNRNLVPEVANTTTLGVVLQPAFLPNFSLAVDLYRIRINNAIINASGFNTTIQRECENSNGASAFCALLERPLPFSDRTPANFPTRVLSQNINAARQWTHGVDVEANYRFNLADVAESLPGALAIRALASYQPVVKRQTVTSVPPTNSAGVQGSSKLVVNLGFDYNIDNFSLLVTERWQSKQQPSDRSINYDLRPDIPAYSYTDISMNYEITLGGHKVTPFVTVENLFNKKPPIVGTQNNVPGLFFPGASGYDIIGRYFTAGIRGKF